MTVVRKSDTSIVIYLQQVSSTVEAAEQVALGAPILFQFLDTLPLPVLQILQHLRKHA